jgi:hypothetical protein
VKAFTSGAKQRRRRDDVFSELTWAAHKDIGVMEIPNDAAQRALVKSDLFAWSTELYVLPFALFNQFSELPSVHHVLRSLRSNYYRHLARRRKLFEQRSERCYTDARSDKHDSARSETVPRERPVGAFNEHPRAALKTRDRSTLIAEALHGNAHVRRSRKCRERIGMGVPPKTWREKAPLKELTPRHGETREFTPGNNHRVGVRRDLPY